MDEGSYISHEDKRIAGIFNRMLNDVLSVVQVATKNEYQYRVVRAKVLRAGNDALRDVIKDLHSGGRPSDEKTENFDVEE